MRTTEAFMTFFGTWALKFAVGGFMYWLSTTMGSPEWIVIGLTAIGFGEPEFTLELVEDEGEES